MGEYFEAFPVTYKNVTEIVPASGVGEFSYDIYHKAVASHFIITNEFKFVHEQSRAEIKKDFFLQYVNRYQNNLILLVEEINEATPYIVLEQDLQAPNQYKILSDIEHMNTVELTVPKESIMTLEDIVTEVSNDEDENQDAPPYKLMRTISCLGVEEFSNFNNRNTAQNGNYKFSTEEIRKLITSNKEIVANYQKNPHSVNNRERIIISKTIINGLLNKNPELILKRGDFQLIVEVILSVFDKNTECAAVYYSPAEFGNPARGKLFDSYQNKRNSLSQAGIISRRKLAYKSAERNSPQETDNKEISFDVEASIEFLSKNIEPWEQIVCEWDKTFNERKQLLETKISTIEYLQNFPCLLEPKGYLLVALDTKHRYPDIQSLKLELLNGLCDKVINVAKQFKTATVKKYLAILAEKDLPLIPSIHNEIISGNYFETDLKRDILKLIVNIYNENSVSRKQILQILKQSFTIFQSHLSQIIEKIDCSNNETVQHLQKLHNSCTISSEYIFFKELSDANYLTYPLSHSIKTNVHLMNKNTDLTLRKKHVTIQLIDLTDLFSKMFNETNLLSDILNYINKLNNVKEIFITNYIQSSSWKMKLEKIVREDDVLVLPLFLYFDEFEPNNPLGSSSNKQKIGAVYVMLPCMPDYLQSQLSQIYLAMLFFTADKKHLDKNANKLLFSALITQLNNLQTDGIKVNHPQYKKVKIVVALILGDNLGLNQILGFVESFNANIYCRICKCNRNAARCLCLQQDSYLRNELNYEQDVKLNDAKVTGIKEVCAFNDLSHFSVIENLAVDIMHDILEGVAHYDIIRILKQFIYTDQFFNLEIFNSRIKSFDFGIVLNKPPEIKEETLMHGTKLRYSASEMSNLILYLNCLIGDLIPRDNKYWNLYLMLREILLLVYKRKVDINTSKVLQNIIADHHEQFMALFQEDLRPKFHIITHYPYIMNIIGPLKNISCIRFEAKHQQFKEIGRATKSRKNLLHTLALKNQLKFCYLIFNYNDISSENRTPTAKCQSALKTDSEFQDVYKLPLNQFHFIDNIKFKGITYKPGLIVAIGYYEDDIPYFILIQYIVKIDNELFLCCQALETLAFDPYLQLFFVKKCNEFLSVAFKYLEVKKIYKLFNFSNKLAVNNL